MNKARALFVDYAADELHAEAEYERCYAESKLDLEDNPEEEEEDSPESLVDVQSDVEPPDKSDSSDDSDF